MALVLAIEANSGQADALRHLLRTHADTDLVVVSSTDAAVTAIDERVPDLVLVVALLSPRDVSCSANTRMRGRPASLPTTSLSLIPSKASLSTHAGRPTRSSTVLIRGRVRNTPVS